MSMIGLGPKSALESLVTITDDVRFITFIFPHTMSTIYIDYYRLCVSTSIAIANVDTTIDIFYCEDNT